MTPSAPTQALADLTVIELGSLVAAPFCAKLLADMGAAVIKVEPPLRGDPSRSWGPFPGDAPHIERSGLFFYVNSGKQSVTVDVETSRGRDLLLRLLENAEVFVCDRTTEEMERFGFGYDKLRVRFPGLVIVAITPYGLVGPCAEWKAHSLNVSHAGLEAAQLPKVVYGSEEEAMKRPPVQVGGMICDYDAGLQAAGAALAALSHRDAIGEGALLDVSRQDVELSLNRLSFSVLFGVGVAFRRDSRETVGISGTVMCKDGLVTVSYNHEHVFKALMEFIGREDLLEDPRFNTRPQRLKHGAELLREIAPWAAQFTREELFHALNQDGSPTCYFPDTAEVVASPQMESRGFFAKLEHPNLGQVLIPTAACDCSETAPKVERAPLLGEHNEEVLYRRLGTENEELARLRADGIV